jgi:hypothetical protein
LLSFITLRAKLAPELEPPLIVGEAEIADGIVQEIIIAADEAELMPGMVLQAKPFPVQRENGTVISCRFTPCGVISKNGDRFSGENETPTASEAR